MTAANVRNLAKSIEDDLDWRNSELAIFREMLTLVTASDTKKRAMYRAGWALLYAHYEGFTKFCLDSYIEFVSKNLPNCVNMPDRMFVYFIDSQIRKAKLLSSEAIFSFFHQEVSRIRTTAPSMKVVDTQSNLWPEVLDQLLLSLDLFQYNIVDDKIKLKTLVARRNDIAHGKRVFIDSIGYYSEYEGVVTRLMYSLALAVVDRCERFVGI
jgi:hypothetical protein